MPGWNIHLEAGSRLADRLQLSGEARKAFLLGCLLPDINNGYINKVSVTKEHEETHYTSNQSSPLDFYTEYKSQIDQKLPLYLGYLFHLYTDDYFNHDFYRQIEHHPLGEGKSRDEQREVKHHDFWIFDTNFSHRLNLTPTDRESLVAQANQIPPIDLIPADVADVERILADPEFSNAMKGKTYLFYTAPQLEDLMERMITNFTQKYLTPEGPANA